MEELEGVSDSAVLPKLLSVVRGDNDQGVLFEAKDLPDPRQVFVQNADLGVVGCAILLGVAGRMLVRLDPLREPHVGRVGIHEVEVGEERLVGSDLVAPLQQPADQGRRALVIPIRDELEAIEVAVESQPRGDVDVLAEAPCAVALAAQEPGNRLELVRDSAELEGAPLLQPVVIEAQPSDDTVLVRVDARED